MTDFTDDDITALLLAHYGQSIVRGVLPPERRRQAWQVHGLIASCDGEAVARAWMIGMNPHLGDQAPLVAIGAGRIRDVEEAAKAYVEEAS